jgi:aminomethyltransferase
MVPFSGWSMPVQYEGIVAEHTHARQAAGLFDLSHMGRLTIEGPDAEALIQSTTTNDITRLAEGAIHYTLICNDQGGVVEDLLVYRYPDTWRLVVNASNRPRVLEILDRVIEQQGFTARVQDDTFDSALIAIQGPDSEAVLQPYVAGDLHGLAYYHARYDRLTTPPDAAAPSDPGAPVMVSRTGYTGEDGFEVIVDAAVAPALWGILLADPRVRPVGLGARDTLRLEAGMALYGHELTEDVTPYEARLGRVVRLEKGAFLGSNALAGLRDRPPARQLVGLRFGTGAIPRAGYRVRREGEDIGEVASGTFSPTLREPIATAYVRTEFAEMGTPLGVVIRDTEVPARVVKLPFVPHHTRPANT